MVTEVGASLHLHELSSVTAHLIYSSCPAFAARSAARLAWVMLCCDAANHC